MHHFKKKILKEISPEGPRENVWGLHKNVSLGPTVALNGPVNMVAMPRLHEMKYSQTQQSAEIF